MTQIMMPLVATILQGSLGIKFRLHIMSGTQNTRVQV